MRSSRLFVLAMSLIGLSPLALGQEMVMPLPADELIAPQDKQTLDRQATGIFKSWDSLSRQAGISTVIIVAGNRQLAQGMIVAEGKVLTKYSDLKQTRVPLSVLDSSGQVHDMRPIAAIPEYDLVLLDVPGLTQPPLTSSVFAEAKEGDMIAAVSAGGHTTDFGVISVDQRSLREEDMPYLGLVADSSWEGAGARIAAIERNSGAHRAGLLPGDVLLQMNGFPLEGMFSLGTALQKVKAGGSVPFIAKRNGTQVQGTLKTSGRPKGMKFPHKRLELMNSMGNRMSSRRSDFPLVFQTDMTLLPERAGCPVINLEGKVIGMALSRAGRMETYILPSWVMHELAQGLLPKINLALDAKRGEQIPFAEPVDGTELQPKNPAQDASLKETLRALQEMMQRLGYQPKDY
ncbi:MAG: PDZ domain-containing protein [Akkermansia sp.]